MSDPTIEMLSALFAQERIAPHLAAILAPDYLALSRWIEALQRKAPQRTLFLGICGAQGSGKPTLTLALTRLLSARGLGVAQFSLDDFYLEKASRADLSRTVHPLLATRGVPGTHNLVLLRRTIALLKASTSASVTPIPRFDKSQDNPFAETDWPAFVGRADIILFEGWCVGAKAQPASALAHPVNALERDEDGDGIWRTCVNARLSSDYDSLFGQLDDLIMLRAPGFETVLSWRREQEAKLRLKRGGAKNPGVMTAADLERFVMHYERMTRDILAEMPQRAGAIVGLSSNREIESIDFTRA